MALRISRFFLVAAARGVRSPPRENKSQTPRRSQWNKVFIPYFHYSHFWADAMLLQLFPMKSHGACPCRPGESRAQTPQNLGLPWDLQPDTPV